MWENPFAFALVPEYIIIISKIPNVLIHLFIVHCFQKGQPREEESPRHKSKLPPPSTKSSSEKDNTEKSPPQDKVSKAKQEAKDNHKVATVEPTSPRQKENRDSGMKGGDSAAAVNP